MSGKLELLPGSIGIEKNPSDSNVWNILRAKIQDNLGFLGYRVLPLGNKNIRDTPSFTIISSQYGLVFVDVCSDKLTAIDNDDYWTFENFGALYSRDALCEFFEDEAKKRLKKSSAIYNRKERKFVFPINRLIVFYQNTTEELDNIELEDFVSSSYISNQNIEQSINDTLASFSLGTIDSEVIDIIYSLLEGTSSYGTKKPVDMELITVNDFIQKSLNVTLQTE